MRYYVIINGVNSLTIEGLAIRTLPPISKPAMRNLREEIDGRDGDITTELGYGAYDRILEIGLYGAYDIDRIISFFNTKGTIIFSDEPDKYYNFEIVDKIDYTKLVKFRTASINIHCQPFKYPTEEEPEVEEYEYVTGTGTDITLDNTEETEFNEIELQGNTSQNGTSTPSSPIPVNVVSGDNTIEICGKNYLDLSLFNNTEFYTISGNNVISNKSDNRGWNIVPYIILGAGTYTIISRNTMKRVQIGNVSTASVIVNGNGVSYQQFTLNETTKVGIKLFGVSTDTYPITYEEPMLLKGAYTTYPTTYEPYIGNTYHITLPSGMFLGGIGNYVDFLFKAVNGVEYYDSLTQAQKDLLTYGSWYLHKEIGKVVLDGSENNWSTLSASGGYSRITFLDYPTLMNFGSSRTTNLYCNNFYVNTENNYSRIYQYENDIYFSLPNGVTTREEFLQLLSTNNSIVYYVLATPTNTLIEDTTLIEQLEALKLANSYEGQTNITQVSNDLPFMMKVSAFKIGSDHLEINNTGNIYSKPTIELEGTGIVDIYLNDVQVFEVDLSEKNEIVIDTEKMEAYNPTDNTLANRQVTGDYSKIKLEPGENNLRFSGALSKATVTKYKRWL